MTAIQVLEWRKKPPAVLGTTAGDTLFGACATASDFFARDFWKSVAKILRCLVVDLGASDFFPALDPAAAKMAIAIPN